MTPTIVTNLEMNRLLYGEHNTLTETLDSLICFILLLHLLIFLNFKFAKSRKQQGKSSVS